MGQFSWLDCKTEEQIIDNKTRDVYVLIPKEFGGGHIKEVCYDGYGDFGGYDIYDLIATWNRETLSKRPTHIFPYAIDRAKFVVEYLKSNPDYSEKIDLQIHNKFWYEAYANLELTEEEVEKQCNINWRSIGIALACYDEDNEALPFPIKITHDPNAIYEFCAPSKSDPNQGWENEEEDDEWDWYEGEED